MFRIDINPNHPEQLPSSQQQQQQKQQKNEQKPLYACLQTSTASEKNDGVILLSIGRKDANVTFSNDKSVSRRHALIKLITKEDETKNDSEKEAFNNSLNGVLVVAEDCGSKFGSFIYEASSINTENKQPYDKNDDDDDDDDQTDDEGMNNPKYSQLNNEATQAATQTPLIDLKHVLGKQKSLSTPTKLKNARRIILSSLSYHNFKSESESIIDQGETYILFGVQGSSIRIQRIPLVFTYSRIPKKIQNSFSNKKLFKIGAILSSNWDASLCTHLVCAKRLSTAKNVCAWACRKPMVLPEFLNVLFARENPSDDFPLAQNYKPEGIVAMDEMNPALDRGIFREYPLFLSFGSMNEMEALVTSAQGRVFSIKDIADDVFFEDLSWLPFNKYTSWIVLNSDSRTYRKKKEFLMQHLKKIYFTDAVQLASSISSLTPLKDLNGNEIPLVRKITTQEEDPSVVIPSTLSPLHSSETNTQDTKTQVSVKNSVIEIDSVGNILLNDKSEKKNENMMKDLIETDEVVEENNEKEMSKEKIEKPKQIQIKQNSSKKNVSENEVPLDYKLENKEESNNNGKKQELETLNSNNICRNTRKRKERILSKDAEIIQETEKEIRKEKEVRKNQINHDQESNEESSNKKLKTMKKACSKVNQSHIPNEPMDTIVEVNESNSTEVPSAVQYEDENQNISIAPLRKLKPLSKKGWITANKKPTISKHEDDKEEDEIRAPAMTTYLPNLIVKTYSNQPECQRKSTKLKNLKTFRKNRVIIPSFDDEPLLTAVFPKESLRQREMISKQRERDKQRNREEALFHDDGNNKKKKIVRQTKRKATSNLRETSIAEFFSPDKSQRRKYL